MLLGKRHGSLFRLLYELATKLLDRFTTVMGSGFSDASEDFSDFKSYSGCPQSTSEEVPRQISAGNAETEVGMWGRTGHLNCFGTTSVFGLEFPRSCGAIEFLGGKDGNMSGDVWGSCQLDC